MQHRKREYLGADEALQAQLQAMHRALLEGEHLEPPKLKALLNRKPRPKERHDGAPDAAGTLRARATSHESDPYP